MIDTYIELLKTLALNPRTAEHPKAEEVSLLRAGKMSQSDVKDALRRVDVLQFLHAPQNRKAPEITQQRMIPQRDHPVNRYVLWRTQQILRNLPPHERNRLQRELQRTFFISLQPEPLNNTALLVLLNDPNYAKLHKIGLSLSQKSKRP